MVCLKDIPVFSTENGAASIVLREIPHGGGAYVRIHSTLEPWAFFEECGGFCRAAGAKAVFMTGHSALEERYPFHVSILRMCRPLEGEEACDAALFPVQEETLGQWLEAYNEKMRGVSNAAWMTREDGMAMLRRGDGYFVHRNGRLLGLGIAAGEKISAVAALEPGAGAQVVRALTHAIFTDRVELEVASDNTRAIRLYERLGFVTVEELSRWYRFL